MLLREKDKNSLITIFQSIALPIEVWAYGSRVNGDAHEGSDLDLVLRTKNLERLPSALFDQLRYDIRESNIPILVELCDWATLPDSFHKNIMQRYEVLYSTLVITGN